MKIRNSKTGEFYEIRNLEYLPLFFRISYEILHSEPELVNMSRNIYKVLLDDYWREKLMSDLFLLTVKDCIAFYIWKGFEINPYIHCFSGYDPLFQLAYCTDYWRDALDDYGFSSKDFIVQAG